MIDIDRRRNDYNDSVESMESASVAAQADDAPAPLARVQDKEGGEEAASADGVAVSNGEASAESRAAPKRKGAGASRVKKEIEAKKAKKAAARAERQVQTAAKAARVPKEKRQRFDVDTLEPEPRAIVLSSAAVVDGIARKTAENTFDLGEAFEAMAGAIPDEKDWKVAVPQLCRLSSKTADNWRAVHKKLGRWREAMIRNQVTPTVLVRLTAASPEQVEQVIAAFEAGKPMKVREVEDMVKGVGATAGTGAVQAGGLKGLKAQALAKVARQTKDVVAGLKLIRAALIEALEAAAGEKRLKKGELVDALAPIAKQVHRDLTELLCDIDPASLVGGLALRHQKAPDERWEGVLALLYRLGGDRWAEATALKAFVEDEVLPMLAFVLDGITPDGEGPDDGGGKRSVEVDEDADTSDGNDAGDHEVPSAFEPVETQGVAASAASTLDAVEGGSTASTAGTQAPPRRRVSQATLERHRRAAEEGNRSYELYCLERDREAMREMEEREAEDHQQMLTDFASGKIPAHVLVPGLAAFAPSAPTGKAPLASAVRRK
ncbi:hypothetical protein [Mangrovibrevibacter kandeliae]|uniref:hypothetical protein n=1 Tax=Mangrovibrevibacter kandeliae TaxID=2968473 RepID=UPI00211776F5|nr:hypothetical protein [Aurantimonas sp. CSK15Z-1]MCQ8782916.1 hypothetical protein [Aurantimonas sp. CSK15Z-1]